MRQITSKDGTTIAFDQSGKGPAIILVVGAFNDRATGAPLASQLIANQIAALGDWRGKVLARPRKVILDAAPDITEEWKRGTAVWTNTAVAHNLPAWKKR